MASNTGCTSVGRAGDHLQDVGRGGLPLQRFLGLVEQPDILDGNHRLVGKDLEQLDMAHGERTGLLPGLPQLLQLKRQSS